MDSSARWKSSGVGSIVFAIVLVPFGKQEIQLCADIHQHPDDAINRPLVQRWRFGIATTPHHGRVAMPGHGGKMACTA
jgi:hypothetical protein